MPRNGQQPDKTVNATQLPERFTVQQVQWPGAGMKVLMHIEGPWGEMNHVLDAERAIALGETLLKVGRAGDVWLPAEQ